MLKNTLQLFVKFALTALCFLFGLNAILPTAATKNTQSFLKPLSFKPLFTFGTGLTEINDALQLRVLPNVLASLPHAPSLFDEIPVIPESSMSRVGKTNTFRVPRNINTYTIGTLADGGTVSSESKSLDFVDITATRKYASETLTHGYTVQALLSDFPSRLSNMIQSLYRDLLTTAYTGIANTVGVSSVGVDNVAITRAVMQAAKTALTNADVPAENRRLALGATSEDDVAAIADYNRAFSSNGNIPREKVPSVAGFDVWSTPDGSIPDGAAGKINIGAWLPALARIQLDESPELNLKRALEPMRIEYRGVPMFLWVEEIDGSLGGIRVSLSATTGSGVLRESAVVLVLGR